VIVEGDAGEEFFLIESGNAVAIKKDANGKETVVKQMSQGDYFGGEYPVMGEYTYRRMISFQNWLCWIDKLVLLLLEQLGWISSESLLWASKPSLGYWDLSRTSWLGLWANGTVLLRADKIIVYTV
jgi:hypothetical protein